MAMAEERSFHPLKTNMLPNTDQIVVSGDSMAVVHEDFLGPLNEQTTVGIEAESSGDDSVSSLECCDDSSSIPNLVGRRRRSEVEGMAANFDGLDGAMMVPSSKRARLSGDTTAQSTSLTWAYGDDNHPQADDQVHAGGMDNLTNRLESWCITNIRSRQRRNNLFDGVAYQEDVSNQIRKSKVRTARQEVMKVLKRPPAILKINASSNPPPLKKGATSRMDCDDAMIDSQTKQEWFFPDATTRAAGGT